jgi:hypothetical protein
MWWRLVVADPTPGPGGQVNPTIDKTGLPGGDALAHLIGGGMYIGLLVCVLVVVIGAAGWGLSAYHGNYQGAYLSRKGVLYGFGGAVLIGGGATIVNFAFGVGQQVH